MNKIMFLIFSLMALITLSGCSGIEGVSSSNLKETQELVDELHPHYLSGSEMTEVETEEIIYEYFNIIGNDDVTEQERKMFDETKNLILAYELIQFKDVLDDQYELGLEEYEKSKKVLEDEYNISFEVSDE